MRARTLAGLSLVVLSAAGCRKSSRSNAPANDERSASKDDCDGFRRHYRAILLASRRDDAAACEKKLRAAGMQLDPELIEETEYLSEKAIESEARDTFATCAEGARYRASEARCLMDAERIGEATKCAFTGALFARVGEMAKTYDQTFRDRCRPIVDVTEDGG